MGEDARAGRLYLPRQWMIEEGLAPDAWLRSPVFNDALARVIERLLAEADRLYGRAEAGITLLPRDCQAAIRAASLVYAEIGRELERRSLDSVSQRAVVSAKRKLMLVGKALGLSSIPGMGTVAAWNGARQPTAEDATLPALAATQFLVDAALEPADARPQRHDDETGRVVWLIDLFERREKLRRGQLRLKP